MRGYCSCCGQECEVKVVDNGIGSYEFWGAKGYDSRPEAVSECCEADVFADEDCHIPLDLTDFEDDRGDYEYDRRKDHLVG